MASDGARLLRRARARLAKFKMWPAIYVVLLAWLVAWRRRPKSPRELRQTSRRVRRVALGDDAINSIASSTSARHTHTHAHTHKAGAYLTRIAQGSGCPTRRAVSEPFVWRRPLWRPPTAACVGRPKRQDARGLKGQRASSQARALRRHQQHAHRQQQKQQQVCARTSGQAAPIRWKEARR